MRVIIFLLSLIYIVAAESFEPIRCRISAVGAHIQSLGQKSTTLRNPKLHDRIPNYMVVASQTDTRQKASLQTSTVNLLKNCVGGSAFSLSAKLLSFASLSDHSILPKSTSLIFLLCLWASYTFYMVTDTCCMTGSTSYADCWAESVSPKTKWVAQAVVGIGPLVGCLANTIILTDLFSGILQSLGAPVTIFANRNLVAAVLCIGVLYPLCSLPNLNAMKNASLLGLLGQVIATLVIALRAMDKSYFPGGVYALEHNAAAVVKASVLPPSTGIYQWCVFAALLSYCCVSHYNAPKYYNELHNPSVQRTTTMILTAYLGSALFYALTLYLGIAAFGGNCKPYLLNSLSAADPLAVLARVAIAASIIASTPLMFMNVRNTLINIAEKRILLLANNRAMAALLVFTIGAISTQLHDVGKIGSIAGALLGINIMFTLPPIMHAGAVHKQATTAGSKVDYLIILKDLLLAVCGASLSVVAATHTLSTLYK